MKMSNPDARFIAEAQAALLAKYENESIFSLLQRCDRAEGAVERAFQMLEIYGVPRGRARSVTNGIDVLVTRLNREVQAGEIARQLLEKDAKNLFQSVVSLRAQMFPGTDQREVVAKEYPGIAAL